MGRKRRNPDQRALIPALPMSEPQSRAPRQWVVTFKYEGVSHIRYCTSRIYYEALLNALQMFAENVQGHEPSTMTRSAPGVRSVRRSAPQSQ